MKQPNTDIAYRRLPPMFYSDAEPSAFTNPRLVKLNTALGKTLGLDDGWLHSKQAMAVLSGQQAIGGGPALAMAYGGHQFGHWSGLLGDGRARLVGDVRGLDEHRYELHLKGAGRTPYSRGGDGKATLGSVIREYILSEAMSALGTPTTRALSMVTTGETIMRSEVEQGAILCRSARSHIRVGTFQWAAASGERQNIKALADFAIDRLYEGLPMRGADRYRAFLRAVIKAQAELIAKWMGFGFIHGVMNTDNMCVSGETIDYGPCAFIDDFHPAKVFSSIDRNGRYAWNQQPEIGHWNLLQLAQTLLPLFGETEEESIAAAQADLQTYVGAFESAFNGILSAKFGYPDKDDHGEFTARTWRVMAQNAVDFTLFFRNLTKIAAGEKECQKECEKECQKECEKVGDSEGGVEALVIDLFDNKNAGKTWLEEWKVRTSYNGALAPDTLSAMQSVNPILIARNHRVQRAIEDANIGNLKTFETLLDALKHPFTDRPEFAEFETPPSAKEIVSKTYCGT